MIAEDKDINILKSTIDNLIQENKQLLESNKQLKKENSKLRYYITTIVASELESQI
jgi:regulator of replication initiation timing